MASAFTRWRLYALKKRHAAYRVMEAKKMWICRHLKRALEHWQVLTSQQDLRCQLVACHHQEVHMRCLARAMQHWNRWAHVSKLSSMRALKGTMAVTFQHALTAWFTWRDYVADDTARTLRHAQLIARHQKNRAVCHLDVAWGIWLSLIHI